MPKSKKVFLTEEGLEATRHELENLLTVQRPKATERVSRAREFGDLTENSEYDQAKEELGLIDGKIVELEGILKNYEIIPKAVKKQEFVVIGSTVAVEVDGEIDEFMIVGSPEADPSQKKISNESPVGQALLGAKIGEVIEVTTPIVRAKYKIKQIK